MRSVRWLPIGSRRMLWAALGALGSIAAADGADEWPAPLEPPAVIREPTVHKDWTVKLDLSLTGTHFRAGDLRVVAATQPMSFERAEFFVALGAQSATHDGQPKRARAWTRLGQQQEVTPTIEETDRADDLTLRAPIGKNERFAVGFIAELRIRSHETRIDERRAARVGWPADAWPAVCDGWLKPEPLIESESESVRALLRGIMPANPRSMPPYQLAKHIAGGVAAGYQPSGNTLRSFSIVTNGNVDVRLPGLGFEVRGAEVAAREKRGSPLDLPCLLTAAYRAAGIPARMVCGIAVKDARGSERPVPHAWVEFYLYDEPSNRGQWVPVDIIRLKRDASRPPPVTQAWRYFGSCPDSEYDAAIGFRWLPGVGTGQTAYGFPGAWSWKAEPATPLAEPRLRTTVRESSLSAEDMPSPRRRR